MWNKLLFCYGLKWKISPHAFSCSKFVCCIENLSSICIACHILRTSTVCFSIITLLSRGLQCIKKRKDLTTNSHFLRLMSYSEHRRTNIAIQQKLNFSNVISFICYLIFIFTFIQCEKINLEKISYSYVPSTYMYTPTGAPVYSQEGGAAEQSAYDPSDKTVYIVGRKTLLSECRVRFKHFSCRIWYRKLVISCYYFVSYFTQYFKHLLIYLLCITLIFILHIR